MSVSIKTPAEQDQMRVAGRLAAEVLMMIEPHIQPGVTTDELNRICHDYIVNVQKAIPAPLGYGGDLTRQPFPKSVCTSVNHVVCHGIPDDRRLKKGDILNIDVTVIKDGWHGDTNKTFFVGEVPVLARRLTQVAHDAMCLGIEQVRPGATLGDIGAAIQRYVEKHRFSVVRDYCGHGIGRKFHEDPQVLHYGEPGTGLRLEPGMCFTIEPMVNAGSHEVQLKRLDKHGRPDGWTVVTKDHSLSAQWEHSILVTPDGHEVLTHRNGEI